MSTVACEISENAPPVCLPCWRENPHRPVSLWHMLKAHAEMLVSMGRIMGTYAEILRPGAHQDSPLDDRSQKQMLDLLRALERHAQAFGLEVTRQFANGMVQDFEATPPMAATVATQFDALYRATHYELKSELFTYIPKHRASYLPFDVIDRTFGERVHQAFPSAVPDMRSAGHSFAVGLYTAAVFHCMRVLELGLREVARTLEAKTRRPIEYENWGEILKAIGARIKELENLSAKSANKGQLQFFSEVASAFWFFKEAWRNHVSHSRVHYEEPQAKSILDRVADFMKKIAEGGILEADRWTALPETTAILEA